MAILATIRSPPALEDYTPLEEHQSQTPETFHGGKPVLHYHASGAKAWIPKSQRGKLPFFPADLSTEPTAPEGIALGDSLTEFVEQKVDLFVNSQCDPPLFPGAYCNANTETQNTDHLLSRRRGWSRNPIPHDQHTCH